MAAGSNTPTLNVTVASADAAVWSGQASQVVAMTTEGSIGIRPGHTPMLAALAHGEVRVTTADGEVITADASDGFLSVSEDLVTVVAGEAAIVK